MRLEKQQVNEITDIICREVSSPFELYLVGSRANDSARGGDIDLLLIVFDSDHIETVLKKKHKIIDQIMAQPSIDETKTDLIIGDRNSLQTDPFISTLNDAKVSLFSRLPTST